MTATPVIGVPEEFHRGDFVLTSTGHKRHRYDGHGHTSCGQKAMLMRTVDHLTEFGQGKFDQVHTPCKICAAAWSVP